MDASKISDLNRHAMCQAMHYWIARWDWECPTLFGIELDEFKEHARSLCSDSSDWTLEIGVTANNVLNELLNGASALSRDKLEETIGIPFESVEALLATVSRMTE